MKTTFHDFWHFRIEQWESKPQYDNMTKNNLILI